MQLVRSGTTSIACLSRLITAARPRRWQTTAAPAQDAAQDKSVDVLGMMERRGLIKDVAGDRAELRRILIERDSAAYSGIDPTASSLHLGHLVPLNILFWLYRHGHRAVSLLGDATVRIGDPTDRLQARKELAANQRVDNITKMRQQLGRLWDNMDNMLQEQEGRETGPDMKPHARRVVDANNRWLSQLSITDYLATVGQCGKIGAMLSRDTVKNRLEKGESMSLAEFNYPMIQAYDWWYMFQESGVEIQIGGSDQYGNIVSGMDLIDYMMKNDRATPVTKGKKPFGITTPLLTTSAGDKFGKSAGNAVWLDPELTKPFDLYGYLLRTADDDVERFLKLLTLVPERDISEIMVKHLSNPSRRQGQHLLALNICRLAYGHDWAAKTAAEHAKSRRLTLQGIAEDSERRVILPRSLFEVSSIGHLLLYAGLAESVTKGNALRRSGGLYRASGAAGESDELRFVAVDKSVNNVESKDLLIGGKYIILRSGKWKVVALEVVDDVEFDTKGLQVPGLDDWRERASSLQNDQVS
ncbi:Tyrosine--tRNA ligase-like protein [Elsinoe fawcettii]|nr:Tyrosine--tRNA ligase-like protein [Elsinoe fawcettii]